MPFGWAVLGSAVIGAVGSNVAANKQASAQEQAAQTQQNMFNTITGQEQPFLNAGYGAETSLSNLLGMSGNSGVDPSTGLPVGYLTQQFKPTQDQLNNYPGYQFALQTGGQAIRNADTPGSGALSGAALKDLMNFNVGTANQYYGQYFNQFQTQQNNIFNRLSQIASLGQNAAGNLGNAGTQLGTGIAQAQAAAGGSLAGGIVGATNSLSGVPLNAMYGNYLGNNAANYGQGNSLDPGSTMPTDGGYLLQGLGSGTPGG